MQGSKAQASLFTIYTDPEVSTVKQQQQQQQQDRGPSIYRNFSEAGANGKQLPSGSGLIYEDPPVAAAGEAICGSVSSAPSNVANKWSTNKVVRRAMQPLTDPFETGDGVDRNRNQCPNADFDDEIDDVEMMTAPNSVRSERRDESNLVSLVVSVVVFHMHYNY